MKHIKLPMLGLSLAVVGVAAFTSLETATGTSPEGTIVAPNQVPVRLVYAQPYRVDEPYKFSGMHEKDAPTVSGGWVIVVSTDPEIADVKQTHDELLFVGDQLVERVNVGADSGMVVGFVPAELDADGLPTLDLRTEPIYWAKPEILPESMTALEASAVLASAVGEGVVPQIATAVEQARAAGGDTVDVRTLGELYRYSAEALLPRFAPEEADLISGLTAEKLYE